jgi:predicted RNA-binding protein YlqC (UPF0109 family)
MSSSIDQQFIEYIVKSLVSNPDAVQVERRIDEKGVLLELTVDPEDLGRVIGKRGATAQSLRTLLRALGTKNDARYNLKIIDNGVGGQQHGAPRDDQSQDFHGSQPQVDDVVSDNPITPLDEPTEEPEAEKVPEQERELGIDQDEDEHNSVVSKTRKELEELDDLDV